MQKWAEDYEKLLLKATEYSGSRQSGEKVISASSINKEPYNLLIQHLFSKKEQDSYGANTIGSIYQLGVDNAIRSLEPDRYEIARRMEIVLPNGWKVSGELDVFDKQENIIIDNKVISDYSYKEVMKNNIDSDYNLQVATYIMLDHMLKTEDQITSGSAYKEPACGALAITNKGGSAVKNNIQTYLDLFTYSPEEMYNLFIEKSNQLQEMLDEYNSTGKLPDEICDTFKYGADKGIPKRCLYYCDYNSVCPAFVKKEAHFERKIINGLESGKKDKQKEEYIRPMTF